jgi:molecular chaperone HtpG
MTKEQSTENEFKFEAEMEQLMHLIIHSLYTHKEIFLRELISNASDALQKIRFIELTESDILDAGKDLEIQIELDEKSNKLIIRDNGIGMTNQEIRQNIGTIAKSGTLKFLKELKAEDKKNPEELIGQFGVGFYSVFMVASDVIVKSKSYLNNEPAVEWKSSGTSTYAISSCDKIDRGTEIIINLKSDEKDFTSEYTIKNIIQKYSNFVDFPIKLGQENINKSAALWRKKPSEIKPEDLSEFYKFISHDFNEPLGHLHVNAEAPLTYNALLFIPDKTSVDFFQKPDEFHLHLYVKKVFIQNDCKDLLPPYLRFIRGVVDSEDLVLNVSREVTQHSPVTGKIKKALTARIFKMLENWAEKDKDKFQKFYMSFGTVFKEGVESDYENKDKIVNLLRFKSSAIKEDEWTSLAEYVQRLKPEQKEIYFISGRNLETIKKNPNLEYFTGKGFEVLFIIELIDEYLMPVINKYNDLDIKHVEKVKIESEGKENTDYSPEIKKAFLDSLKNMLADKIEDIKESIRLVNSPCSLVSSELSMNSHMEQMMKIMNPDFKPAKKIMEINFGHHLIKKMVDLHQKDPASKDLEESVNTLYTGLLLIEDKLENPGLLFEKLVFYMEKSI